MSRYDVVALMRAVNMNPASLAAYRADPAGFVVAWPGGLSAEEEQMLAARDFAALYAFGAHPFLLWSFTEAIYCPETPRSQLVEWFRTAAAAVGYPDPSIVPLLDGPGIRGDLAWADQP
jgi:hypothetical protein